jgi:uncharacterized membrane protein
MPLFEKSDDDDTPVTLVGVEFSDVFRAQEFLTAVTRLSSQGNLRIKDAVFIAADADGKTIVRETIDPTPRKSALGGAMWAGLVGLLIGGPIGWVGGMAIGAGTGVVSAKVIDLGIPDEWVDWFKQAVDPSKVILALLVSDVDIDELVAEASRFAGAELVYANLDPSAFARLKEALGDPDATQQPEADEPTVDPAGTELPPPAPPA